MLFGRGTRHSGTERIWHTIYSILCTLVVGLVNELWHGHWQLFLLSVHWKKKRKNGCLWNPSFTLRQRVRFDIYKTIYTFAFYYANSAQKMDHQQITLFLHCPCWVESLVKKWHSFRNKSTSHFSTSLLITLFKSF